MAAAIADAVGVQANIVPGGSGEFTVLVDGAKLWDKYESGRFPQHDEILRQLKT